MYTQADTQEKKRQVQPITAAQERLLQSTYKRLVSRDDPRVDIGAHRTGDERADRLRWAWHKVGHEIKSFKELTLPEAQYLLDYCLKGTTKLDEQINAEFKRLNVVDQSAYFNAMCQEQSRSKNFWHFHGRTLHQLSRYDKWKLVSMLKTRAPSRSGGAA